MGLNETPSGERIHIGFFGRRNAGKSSVVNAVTGQDLSIVSDVKGTTTDAVTKSLELLPLGPVVVIDTPGIDDEGALGEERVRRAKRVLNRVDCAILVVDASIGLSEADRGLLRCFQEKKLPYLIAWNKEDLLKPEEASALTAGLVDEEKASSVLVSAARQQGIWELKERIGQLLKSEQKEKHLVADFVKPGDSVVLVIPIDGSAPKGRLILPQQQAIRDLLEAGAIPLCVRDTELPEALHMLREPPKLVITDSQAFGRVGKLVPPSVPLTSFSILMARYKGFLDTAVKGVAAISQLQDGDHVLISEGCTHHRQCEDIGTVKIPNWLKQTTNKSLVIETSSGMGFPEDLTPFRLIIHCGGCMLNERELAYRQRCAEDAGVPFTNYGIAIAYMHGILKRSLAIMPELAAMVPDSVNTLS